VPDDVLQRLAANGGVCMVALVTDFVSDAFRLWRVAFREAIEQEGIDARDPAQRPRVEALRQKSPSPDVTMAEVVAHIEHARDVAGVDHIGIGGDYDGTDTFPVGLENVSCYPALFAELLDRGWSRDDCAKLAGGNVLRALRAAESVANRLQTSVPPSLATLEPSPSAG
jgi:membrane dipeptidase